MAGVPSAQSPHQHPQGMKDSTFLLPFCSTTSAACTTLAPSFARLTELWDYRTSSQESYFENGSGRRGSRSLGT